MTTNIIPTDLAESLQPGVTRYIESYRPVPLTDDQWNRVRADVCIMTARTQPVSCTDARTVLSALAQFVAWSDLTLGPAVLEELLTEINVGRYVRHRQGSVTEETRDSQRSRLERCLRVLAGQPARTVRRGRGAGNAPYDPTDRARLDGAASRSPALARVLRSAIKEGVVSGNAYALAGEGRGYTKEEWEEARSAAESVGVALHPARLRATWTCGRLGQSRPLLVILRTTGVTRRRLNEVLLQLPPVDESTVRDLLRDRPGKPTAIAPAADAGTFPGAASSDASRQLTGGPDVPP
jgi:hypothetical protein